MGPLPSAQQLIAQFDLRASKKFSQNFLLDPHITLKIACAAGNLQGRHVIEVGPGPCGLTSSILQRGPAHVTVIEVDEKVFPLLDYFQGFTQGKLDVVRQDATRVAAWDIGKAPRRIIANLPYQVSTVLLFHWLPHVCAFESMTLMFQKEVAQRIVAPPGSAGYGRLSVMTQWLCEVRKIFDVLPGSFSPPPKVTSSIIHLVPREQPLYPADYHQLETIVAAAFNQRRKMLRSALKNVLGKECAAKLLSVDISPEKRAEQLTIEEFCRLSQLL